MQAHKVGKPTVEEKDHQSFQPGFFKIPVRTLHSTSLRHAIPRSFPEKNRIVPTNKISVQIGQHNKHQKLRTALKVLSIHKWKGLKVSLDIKSDAPSFDWTDINFLQYLTNSHYYELNSIKLICKLLSLTNEQFKQLISQVLKNASMIRKFYFEFRYSPIKNRGLVQINSEIIKALPKLTHLQLDIYLCKGIDGAGAQRMTSQISRNLPGLQHLGLHFGGWGEVLDIDLIKVGQIISHRLPHLKSLYLLCWGQQISDEGLKGFAATICQHLRELNALCLSFHSCANVTAEGFKDLCSQICQYNQGLENLLLDFERCELSSEDLDKARTQYSQVLQKLKYLSFRWEEEEEEEDNDGIDE